MRKILGLMFLALTTITLVGCNVLSSDKEVAVVVVGYDSVEKLVDKESIVIDYLIVKIKDQEQEYYLEVKKPYFVIGNKWKEQNYPIGKELITDTKNLKKVEEVDYGL